jgi:hypothetical protein
MNKKQRRRCAILAFLNPEIKFPACNPPQRRPIKRKPIVLNLDQCRKLIDLLKRWIVHKSDPLHFRRL